MNTPETYMYIYEELSKIQDCKWAKEQLKEEDKVESFARRQEGRREDNKKKIKANENEMEI